MSSRSDSESQSSSVEEEDYYAKFNNITGWQSILLLQFQTQTTILIIFVIYVSYVMVILDMAVAVGMTLHKLPISLEEGSRIALIYAFDMFYLMDLISMTIFKNVNWPDMNLRFMTRHGAILFIEYVSIIPIDLIYYCLVEADMKIFYCLRMRYALRMCRMYSFYKQLKIYVGSHSYTLYLLIFLGTQIVLVVTLACISYIFKCYSYLSGCNYSNPYDIGISLYLSGAIFFLSGVSAINTNDFVIDSILVSCFVFIHYGYFISVFTCSVIQILDEKFTHLNLYNQLESRLKIWKKRNANEWTNFYVKYEKLVLRYALLVWDKRNNSSFSEEHHTIIPNIMYREIKLDISWIPLKHTHLFQNEDVYYLNSLCAKLEFKFYTPGEVIYKRNECKSKMVYIISGIIQILSEEDNETPILSLSSGTCLGEATLVVDYPSTCTVVSKNVCDVVVLERRDFIVRSSLYYGKCRQALKGIMNRCEEAKIYQKISTYQFTKQRLREKVGILTMKWLKLTLRNLLFNVRKIGDLYDRCQLEKLEQNVFCTKYLDLLALAEDVELTADSVFIKNSFPFVFQQDSYLLKAWDILILILVVITIFTYPYFAVFLNKMPLMYNVFHVVISVCWSFDLYLKASTAVKSKFFYHKTLPHILVYNLANKSFIADFIAAFPPELIVYLINGYIPDDLYLFLQANRLFKIYKMEVFFQSIRGSSSTHVIVKYLKFITYMFILFYYLAMYFYMIACYEGCNPLLITYLDSFRVNTTLETMFMCIYFVVEFHGDSRITKFPFFVNGSSFLYLIMAQLCIFVFNSFFLAYISAAQTLNEQNVHKLDEFMRNVDTTMRCFNLNESLQKRVWDYIMLQIQNSGAFFLYSRSLFDSLPTDLYMMTCGVQLGYIVRTIPLLYGLSERSISHVCTIAFSHLLAANELIANMGEVSSDIYVILEGTCSVLCTNGEMRTITSGDSFCILESCLNIPCLNTVMTLTQCKIISINFSKLNAVLLHYPNVYYQLENTVRSFDNYNSLLLLQRATTHKRINLCERKNVQTSFKKFGYVLRKRTKKYYRFHEGFPKWAFLFKYMLLHYTFYSNGNFVLVCEILRCIFAFVSSIAFPMSLVILKQCDFCKTLLLCLDLSAIIDIYLRHHHSYFNEKGIEVTHPFSTARHYWSHGLAIDLIAVFPFGALKLVFDVEDCLWFVVNRLLQLYRIHGLLENLLQYSISNKSLWKIIEYLIYIIVFINLFGTAFFRVSCFIEDVTVICKKDTWLSMFGNDTSPVTAYFYSLFYITSALTNSDFDIMTAKTASELRIYIFLAVSGFITYYYLCAKIIAFSLSINRDLTLYQEAMHSLVTFMSYNRIDKKVKEEIINHFEYMWHKTKGKSIHTTFSPFKKTFKVDALYNIYGMVFADSTIFPGEKQAFFKSLLLDAKHEIYLKNGIIYRVNDVNGIIYMLYKGQIEIGGADSNRLVTLYFGSLFGNLDNCPLGRRTLTAVASGHVEVLSFPSTTFHMHLAKYPKLKNHFLKLTAIHVDYIEEHKWASRENLVNLSARSSKASTNLRLQFAKGQRCRTRIFRRKKFIKLWEQVLIHIICFMSYLVEMEYVTTDDESMRTLLILYALDLLYVLKIYLVFHTCYEDDFGRVVTNRHEIAKRYRKTKLGFYFDLFTVLPFECASLCFLNTGIFYKVLALCRLNRFFRMAGVIVYLQSLTQKLNINVFAVRMLQLLLCTILVQYTLGGLIQFVDSILNYIKPDTIIMRLVSNIKLVVNCSLNLMLTLPLEHFNITCSICLVVSIIGSKLIWIFYIAQSCAILQIVNHTKNMYERYMLGMKSYMQAESVSPPFQEKIVNYISLLWTYHRGVQFPTLLNEAPYYLREAVLNSMFGYHIRNHPLLKNCHIDMIRQMAAQMKTAVFFPGDYVIYTGDVDHCMYFIHEGEIDVLSEDSMHSEIVDHTLHDGDMFGLDQGIYLRAKHEFIYKVKKYSFVVYLQREDWIHLLDFFPASTKLIFDADKGKQYFNA